MALVKPCPRCRRLIPHGWSYCPDCKPIAEAQRQEARERKAEHLRKKYNKRYNSRRDPKYMEFYRSKAWRNTSRQNMHFRFSVLNTARSGNIHCLPVTDGRSSLLKRPG
jgi:hypothetical protein